MLRNKSNDVFPCKKNMIIIPALSDDSLKVLA